MHTTFLKCKKWLFDSIQQYSFSLTSPFSGDYSTLGWVLGWFSILSFTFGDLPMRHFTGWVPFNFMLPNHQCQSTVVLIVYKLSTSTLVCCVDYVDVSECWLCWLVVRFGRDCADWLGYERWCDRMSSRWG